MDALPLQVLFKKPVVRRPVSRKARSRALCDELSRELAALSAFVSHESVVKAFARGGADVMPSAEAIAIKMQEIYDELARVIG